MSNARAQLCSINSVLFIEVQTYECMNGIFYFYANKGKVFR